MPKSGESDDAYKARVHEWLWTMPVEGDYTPGLLRREDEYICSLAGVEAD